MIRVDAPGLSSCFGMLPETLHALGEGRYGAQSVSEVTDLEVPGVSVVYADPSVSGPYQQRAAVHLRRALRSTLDAIPPLEGTRTALVLCTGLGRTPGVEAGRVGTGWTSPEDVARDELGTDDVEVFSLTNACSASGAGFALGADLLSTGTYDQVLLAAADSMTQSMLTMIGKVASEPAARCLPFNEEHSGAVLGEGAAGCLLTLETDRPGPARFGSVWAVECTSDASHPTAPDQTTITDTVYRAIAAAGLTEADLDFVIPHGTGTTLNDHCEAAVYSAMPDLVASACFLPLKGGIGHTSGASFLMSLLTAIAVCRGEALPRYAPERPIAAARGLRWVPAADFRPRHGLVCAYGFGGANAVGVVAP